MFQRAISIGSLRGMLIAAAAALALSACSTTLQVYSSPEHETLRLRQGDLRDGGLAFLTPSTVTGQEEDKQSLARGVLAGGAETLLTEMSNDELIALVTLDLSRATAEA